VGAGPPSGTDPRQAVGLPSHRQDPQPQQLQPSQRQSLHLQQAHAPAWVDAVDMDRFEIDMGNTPEEAADRRSRNSGACPRGKVNATATRTHGTPMRPRPRVI
jgi:hypothetical protein